MSTGGATGPALMHFPLAESYAFYGRRIRRASYAQMPPEEVTVSTPSPSKPVRWFRYLGGLWFVVSWRITDGNVETFERVVEESDFGRDDMLAWDWTTLGPECELGSGDCACSGNTALLAVQPFSEEAVIEESGVTFDLRHGNTHQGDFGCVLPPADPRSDGGWNCECSGGGGGDGSGNCPPGFTRVNGMCVPDGDPPGPECPDCNGGNRATDGGGGKDGGGGGGNGGDGGGGGGDGNGGGGGGGGAGGGGGGRGRPPRPPRPPAPTCSCSLELTRGRDGCYSKSEYTATPGGLTLVENQWSGHLTLNAQDDGSLWFYRVTFRGQILANGTMVPGDNIGVDTGAFSAEPGQSFGMSAAVHKPLSNETCGDSFECVFPDWCPPARSGSSGNPRTPPRNGSRSGGNYVPPP